MLLTVPMKVTLCLSLLLAGLQVHCHHVAGHHEELDHSGEKNPPEHQQQPPAERHRTRPAGYKKIITTNAEFVYRLYKLITSDPAPKNVFFSPLGISTALAMLSLGAKDETHHQIFKGLGFNLSDTEENEIHETFNLIIHTLNQPTDVTQMSIGNALFIDASLPLRFEFLNDVKTLYEAEGFPTNFRDSAAAENEINTYVKNKTQGKITQAVGGLDESTAMVLISYIFFKASWKNPFYSGSNEKTDFFVDANTTVKVNMMHRKGYYNFVRDEDLSCWVVRVPYKGNFSAWFVLPDQGKLKGVEDALSNEVFDKWSMSFKHDEIKLYIPKFSISGFYDLKDLLRKHGVMDVFNDNANLSGITGQRNLKVSKAVHKAMLDVDEAGTQAAAVTVVEAVFLSLRIPPPPVLLFNKPFLMFIVNKQVNQFIFATRVMDPTAK